MSRKRDNDMENDTSKKRKNRYLTKKESRK